MIRQGELLGQALTVLFCTKIITSAAATREKS